MVMQSVIGSLVDDGALSVEQASEAMTAIMDGEATPAQIGAFLAALRIHGETAEVIAACVTVMLEHAEPVPVEDVIDLCGTGGDGIDTFNVSTAAGFLVAGAGVRVAKHGNRAASSQCGSADLLEEFGARIDLGGEDMANVINGCGFGFLFAQRFHPAMKYVGGPRREIGIRTLFNILGPLSNPANPKGQLVGVGAAQLGPLVAEALVLREIPRAMVVHSHEGADEITLSGDTHAWLVEGDSVTEKDLSPSDFGVEHSSLESVKGGNAAANVATLNAVLDGEPGPMADFAIVNAGAALWVAGATDDFDEGAQMARDALTSGKARQVADDYVRLTKEAAG
jgi:anthranilate phosphoribosyltransferase